MIILATVSINAVMGENGLIRKAEVAGQHQANAEASDEAVLDTLDQHLANAIAGNSGSQTPTEPETPSDPETPDEPQEPEGMDASDIKTSASTYYGTKVNYNKAGQEWEIFFADDTNIYLITKASLTDPVYNAKTLSGAVSATTYADGSSMLTADATKNNFPAAEKWFKWPTTDDFASTNDNMKATLFMLDSINVWNATYHTAGTTDYAIGSPTLEMLCKSVNDVNGNNNLVAAPTSAGKGYPQTISSGLTNGTVWNHGSDYWLACPFNGHDGYVRSVSYDYKSVGYGNSNNNYGYRPVVCLTSGVTLEAVEEDGVVTEFNIVGAQ